MGRILLAVGVVVLLAACGDGDTTARDQPADGPTIPEGEYVVTSVEQAGEPRALVSGSRMRLRFRDGTMSVNAGCNHLSSDYDLVGDELRLGPMAGTEMGCPQPLMDQDDWLAGVLAETVTVGNDPLTLTSGDVVFTLELTATDPSSASDPDEPTSDGPGGVTVP
jgi:heat shock protein HslJ